MSRHTHRSAWISALILLLAAWSGNAAHAAIITQALPYKHGEVELVGYLAYDDATQAEGAKKLPAVLVVHEWWGLNDYARMRAARLAELGYVAFAVDMYGQGKTTADAAEAGQWAGAIKADPKLMRERIKAAFDLMSKHDLVDARKIAVIGYCFGGTVALELARSGARVAATVAFHASLNTVNPADARNIRGRVLVCHGADDTFVSETELRAFEKEMRDARVDWQLVSYGGAMHSFTNPNASKAGIKGVAYHEKADRRSWEAMKQLLAEAFL